MATYCMPYMELKSCYIPYIDTVHNTWDFTMESFVKWLECCSCYSVMCYHYALLCII